MARIVLVIALWFAPGCVVDVAPAEPRPLPPLGGGSGPTIGVPPLLDASEHPGWGNPDCAACHTLPAPGHTTSDTYVCAQCHGANGACNPNFDTPNLANTLEVLTHRTEDDCAGCHTEPAETHGFAADVCVNCHFRYLGQENCVPYTLPSVPWGPVPPIGTAPPLGSGLVSGCFRFPERPFDERNHVPDGHEWEAFLGPSASAPTRADRAIDFELRDVDGTPHRLSELLATRPVWLQTGSYTCPVYQNAVASGLNPLAARSNAAGPYAEQIHFVHVYTVEAHPPAEYSPYGSTREFEVSIFPQPLTYLARVENARAMRPLIEEGILVVDALEPTAAGSNPIWCTYATCPACSFLIGRDGVIHEVLERTSMSPDALSEALDAFLTAHP